MKGGQGIPYWVQRWAGLRLVLGWTSLKLNVVAKHYDCSVQVVSCCAASVSAGEMIIDKLIDKAHISFVSSLQMNIACRTARRVFI